MVLLKLHAAVAAAVTLAAGGTAVGATLAKSPIDSSGVIHGCYNEASDKGSHGFVLQNAGTNCPSGTRAISWNQTGPQGLGGAGLTFTTASGVNGPAIAKSGTYIIDVTVTPLNNGANTVTAACGVGVAMPGGEPEPVFGNTNALPGEAASNYTLTGMATLRAGVALTVECFNQDASTELPIQGAQWYVAPAQTS